jgi:trigger factor
MALETKSEVKEVSPVERELSIVIPGDEVAKELDRAYRQLSQKVRMKGYRPGKIPRYVLEQYYKADTEQNVLEKIVGNGFRAAVVSHALTPVADPKITASRELIPGMDYRFQALVEVKPAFEIKQYKGLTLTKKAFIIDDAAVTRQLEAIRERHARVEPVEDRETIQQGDLVECNYSSKIDGENVRGLGGISYVVEVGGGRFFPEAEQALVGKKLGDSFDVDVVVPDDHRVTAARGKTATLSIRVNKGEIKKRVLPELNDEFAKDMSDETETLDALKAKLKEGMVAESDRRATSALKDAAIDALIEANPFEVPKSLVERQAQQLAMDTLQRMPQQAAERIWNAQGDKLVDQARPRALRSVRGGLILEKLIGLEGIEISDEKVDEKLAEVALSARQSVAQVKKMYQRQNALENLRQQIASEVALERVVESANVKVVEESMAPVESLPGVSP